MHAGRIMQYDTPEVLYQRPANEFVARFVGFENLIPMRVSSRDGAGVTAVAQGVSLRLSQEDFGAIPDRFTLATRAEGLALGVHGIPATLGLRTYLGRSYQYRCDTPLGPLTATGPLTGPMEPGTKATLVPVPSQCCILSPE
jgi:putative spermidine/putrescine transport system ATP-binding protein